MIAVSAFFVAIFIYKDMTLKDVQSTSRLRQHVLDAFCVPQTSFWRVGFYSYLAAIKKQGPGD